MARFDMMVVCSIIDEAEGTDRPGYRADTEPY